MSREGELVEAAAAAAGCRPHVVLVPVPAQGHINAATSIARYLAASGICVTVVHAARAHSLLTAAAGAAANGNQHLSSTSNGSSESENNNICVEVIRDGLPSAEAKQSVSVEEVGASMAVMRQGLEELLRRLMRQTNAPCCLMVDSILGWGSDVALQFGLPRIDVWTSSASSLCIGIHIPHLLAKGYLPAGDKETRERTIDCVPGLSSLCIADLPPLFITEEGLQSPAFKLIRSVFENTKGAERVLVNTIHELESAAVEHLRKECGVRIDPVGPLSMIQNSIQNCARAPASLLREDNSCLSWLDKQQSSSVLYVSFGSVANVEEDVLEEVAHALEASGEPFLWVIRPDAYSSIAATVEELLPQGFVERIRDRGLVISWAPQLAVLGHPSVGAFLTHCGWNSVLEGLSNGVPMLGFPQLADQRTILKHIVHDWKVGLSLASPSDDQAVLKVERSHVQSCVTAVMRGNEGAKARQNALGWRDIAQNAIRGTLKGNLQKLVDDLKRGHFGPSGSAD